MITQSMFIEFFNIIDFAEEMTINTGTWPVIKLAKLLVLLRIDRDCLSSH